MRSRHPFRRRQPPLSASPPDRDRGGCGIGLVVAGALGFAALLCCLPLVAGFGGIGAAAEGTIAAQGQTDGSALATSQIPPSMRNAYEAAATEECPTLPWQLLAAIGWTESGHGDGRLDPHTGEVSPPIVGPALDGRGGLTLIRDGASADGYAHALGPMQFLPTTWARYGIVAPWRPAGAAPDPQNAWDAIATAARMLCADGAGAGHLRGALLAYNDSTAYADGVWATAIGYGMASSGAVVSTPATAIVPPPPVSRGGTVTAAPGHTYSGDPQAAVAFAESQLGVPYVWGGTTPGRALDCSGLVLVSYRAAGVVLPRTTFAQVHMGITVSVAALAPGDLLFFAGGQPVQDYEHVGIYMGRGLMIHAPHTGTVVQVAPVPYRSIERAQRILASPSEPAG